jgi:hypothetical protein
VWLFFNIFKMATKKTYTVITKPKEFLGETPKAKGCTLAKDKDGYFVYTHRWASKRFKTIKSIPKSIIEFAESTG